MKKTVDIAFAASTIFNIHTYIHISIHVGNRDMHPVVTRRASLSRYLDVSSTLGRLDIKTLVESTRYQGL